MQGLGTHPAGPSDMTAGAAAATGMTAGAAATGMTAGTATATGMIIGIATATGMTIGTAAGGQPVTGAAPAGSSAAATAQAGAQGAVQKGQEASGLKVPGQRDVDTYECQTCKNRKYQDGSNDPGVSFKTPTHLDPERAAYAIRSDEMEHVAHAKADAAKDEDKEILSQSVTYHTAICPECGRVYMSGGTTRTTFRTSREVAPEPVETGKFLDQVA